MKMVLKPRNPFFLMVLSVLFPFILFILMSVLRVGSLNLNGGRDLHKRALLFELIKQKNIDVMYVQETHSDCFNENDWKKEWEGEVVFAHMSSTRGGVAIFAKNALPFSCEVKRDTWQTFIYKGSV